MPRPDPNDPVRMCVDMRCASKAIRRERHIMPTVDDILNAVHRAKWFSKRDLNSAYHQVELDKESRYITTFSTHLGLRRYKRLFFGISSAGEIFHSLIGEILSDLDGVIHTMDDILVHGETREQLVKRAAKLDKRLEDRGLTVNEKKRKDCINEVKFYGLVLSDKGCRIDPDKVEAVEKTSCPNSKSDVKSFLGLTDYCARFIPNNATVTEPLREFY